MRARFISGAFVHRNIYTIIALNTLGLAFVTAAALLALYALLVYKESGEQDDPVSPLKKFFLLVPVAKEKKWFWLVVIGIPLASHIAVPVLLLYPVLTYRESTFSAHPDVKD